MAKLMFVENLNGNQFSIRLITKGDNYGRNRCLVWNEDQTCIEFYDTEYAGNENFDELGQFISRYYTKTILEIEETGLCLDGSVSKWNIEDYNIIKIQNWINKLNISS